MSDPVPQRIGDAERDRAAEYLREHVADGRLTPDEFEERLTIALQARTAPELEALFSDLPAPRFGPKPESSARVPAAPPWPTPPPGADLSLTTPPQVPAESAKDARIARGLAGAATVGWILFVLSWALGFGQWWFVFIPIALSSLAGKYHQGSRSDRRRSRRRNRNGEIEP